MSPDRAYPLLLKNLKMEVILFMFIGVDLGTSAVKLLAMSNDGEILKTVSVEYPISFPKSGWSEQNPEDWYKGTMEGIGKLRELWKVSASFLLICQIRQ